MLFSVIVGTLGREIELIQLLDSLVKQKYKNFELIIIDQNNHNKVREICSNYSDKINIIYKKVSFRGLSKARNFGLKFAKGRYLLFLDDDCFLHHEYFDSILNSIKKYSEDSIICGRLLEPGINKSSINKFPRGSCELTTKNCWGRHISCTMIIPKKVVDKIGYFDENFGIGSKYFLYEETDYLLRALYKGFKAYYDDSLFVYHPNKIIYSGNNAHIVAFNNAFGFGALAKKHLKYYKNYNILILYTKLLILPLCASIIYILINFSKARFYIFSFYGKIKGFLNFV